MAGAQVTQGAVQGVPISGQYGARVRGQAVLGRSLSTGAAKSEPHRPRWPPGRASRAACVQGGRVCRVAGVPRVHGAASTPGTRTTWSWTSAYTGCSTIKARPGGGKDSAGTVLEQCHNRCQNRCHNRTQHPTPVNTSTRQPVTHHS